MSNPYVGRPVMEARCFNLTTELTSNKGYSFSATTKTIKRCPCKYCGQKHTSPLTAVFCCLFAPNPTGWCAWCGDQVGTKGRSFCTIACAHSFREDVLISRKRGDIAQR